MKQLTGVAKSLLAILLVVYMIVFSQVAMAGVNTFKSDDFNSRSLNRTLWTIRDYSNECAIQMRNAKTDSARVVFLIPGGSEHDLYTTGYRAPNIYQTCANEDFEAEVKFVSPMLNVTSNYFIEGLQVWDVSGGGGIIRFDFVAGKYTGVEKDSVWAQAIYLSNFVNGVPQTFSTKLAPRYMAGYGQGPLWMRVKRTGNIWELFASTNGTTFSLVGSFPLAYNVSHIGPWAGNAGSNAQPFNCGIDYFFNTAAPITPEDGAYVADTQGPYIHGVRAIPQANGLMVIWKTDEPADGRLDYGTTTSYGSARTHSGYFYDHRVAFSGLPTNTTFHYRIAGSDDSAHTSATSDYTVSTGDYILDNSLVSDDFNYPSLDASLWTFVNPRADATISFANKRIGITVPGGVDHNIWTDGNSVPRIEQNIPNNTNAFEVIVKYTTPPAGGLQNIMSQGVILEQDPGNLVLVSLNFTGSSLWLFVGAATDGLANISGNSNDLIGNASVPYYLRVKVVGADITAYWSFNGVQWNQASSPLIRPYYFKKVELYAGAAGGATQTYTSNIDYVRLTLPAKPFLTGPANNAIDIPSPSPVKWDSASLAASYTLQVAPDVNFASPVFNGDVADTTKDVTGLNNSTRYYWRVRGKNAIGNGPYSSIFNFTTAVAAPAAPTLVSPADNAVDVDTNVTLKWNKPATAASYRLQVATDAGFAALIFNDSTLTDTSKALGGLGFLKKYYWRVSAKNSGGTGVFSAARNFTTITDMPAVPTLLSPTNGAVNQQINVTIRWRKPQNATAYRLQVATDSTFASGLVFNDSTLTDTVRAMSGLANNTKHFWRVNSKNIAGNSAFSTVWNFRTIVANPSIPILLSPTDGAVNQALNTKLSWRMVGNANTYRLQVGTDSTFAGGIMLDDSTLIDTTRSVAGLVFNQKYFWRVNAKNIGGTGPYSSVWRFRTYDSDPAIPRQLAPADNATGLDTMVTLMWTRPLDATSFTLQVTTDSAFAGGFLVNGVVIDTFRVLHNLDFLRKYYWRLNADAIGGVSPFTSKRNFSTGLPLPAAVTLLAPSNGGGARADSAVLRWRKSGPVVEKYWLEIAIDSLFSIKGMDSTLTDTVIVRKGLPSGLWHYWKVRAKNAGGWGPFGPMYKFFAGTVGVAQNRGIPAKFELSQNYPNPFNPTTQIEFALPKESQVTLQVYNLLGERVSSLVNQVLGAGYHTASFQAATLPSGIYLYRLTAGEASFVRKMMLMK